MQSSLLMAIAKGQLIVSKEYNATVSNILMKIYLTLYYHVDKMIKKMFNSFDYIKVFSFYFFLRVYELCKHNEKNLS